MMLFDSPYALVLLLAGAVLLWFGVRLWPGVDGGQGRLFGALTLAVGGGWTISHTLRAAAATPEAKWAWLAVEFAALAALPVLWFGYVLWYTDRWTPLGRRVTAGVALVAAGFVALFVTNPSHGLVYEGFQVVEVGSRRIVTASLKLGFWAFVGFAYALVAASLLSLGATLSSTRGVMRWQVAALAGLGSVPAIAAGVAVVDLGPMYTRAVVSGTALLVAIGCGVGVSRFDWTDTAPIARDRALDAMSEIVLVVNGDGRIVDLNCSASSLVPGDPATAIGARATTLVPSLSAVLGEDADAPEPRDAAPRTVTAEADGESRTFAVTVSSIGAARDAGARTVLLRDVTARKRAERRLRQERDRVERLHEVARDVGAARSVDAVCRVATEGATAALDCEAGRIVAADGEALATTGVPDGRSELSASERELASRCCELGRGVVVDDFRDTQPVARRSDRDSDGTGAVGPAPNPIGDAGTAKRVGSEATEATAYRSAVAVPVNEETALQVLATAPSAFDDGDERALELLASHVATALERVAVESRLRDERDRLDEFAGIVSHDLRSPLNVAGGRVDLARRNPDEAGEHLSAARMALTRMEELLDDVLALARDGRAVGEIAPIGVEAAARRAWATVHTEGAELTVGDDLPVVRCDEARLREAFENLFRNAAEHGSTSPHSEARGDAEAVTVTVGALDAGFYVADDGPGIPPDDRERVFESGYSTSESGTGFGLSIVQQIAEAHGWTVEVTSSDAGGARFRFVVGDDVVAEE